MKIIFLSHSFYPAIGGIETISEFLANTLHNAGHQVHILTWTKEEGEKKFPFQVIRNPSVFQLIKQHTWAECVFENNPCVRLAWPALLLRRMSIISLHTWLSRINGDIGWQDKFKFLWLRRAKKVLACSDALRRHSWPEANVIENPYQEELFRRLSDVPKTIDFVFLGRLVSDKGAKLAIDAVFEIIKEYEYKQSPGKLTLTIIGDGPERKRLENFASELGLEDEVAFKGSLEGELLVQELNRHKYMLVPSIWDEPFGIVVLEGMACGCVPIVSNGGGLPEAVGGAGLTFERGNLDSFVSAIKQILEDPALEQVLKNEALPHLAAHYSKIVAQKYLKVLEDVDGQKI